MDAIAPVATILMLPLLANGRALPLVELSTTLKDDNVMANVHCPPAQHLAYFSDLCLIGIPNSIK